MSMLNSPGGLSNLQNFANQQALDQQAALINYEEQRRRLGFYTGALQGGVVQCGQPQEPQPNKVLLLCD